MTSICRAKGSKENPHPSLPPVKDRIKMDELLLILKTNRGLKENTLNMYKNHLNKLAMEITKDKFKNISFLRDKFDDVKKFLSTLGSSTQKNFMASILVALSPVRKDQSISGYEKIYNDYKTLLVQEGKKYFDRINTHQKTDREDKNWLEWDDILKLQRKYTRDVKEAGYESSNNLFNYKKDLDLLQRYLVISLYSLHSPRRLEYANCQIISKKEFNDLSNGDIENGIYLVIDNENNKLFSFGKKAAKIDTVKNVEIIVAKPLDYVINLWLNFNKNKYLLQDSRGKQMTTGQLSKFITKTFSPTRKAIGASMLRKIFITENFEVVDPIQNKKVKLAMEMNHSVKAQQSVYLKLKK